MRCMVNTTLTASKGTPAPQGTPELGAAAMEMSKLALEASGEGELGTSNAAEEGAAGKTVKSSALECGMCDARLTPLQFHLGVWCEGCHLALIEKRCLSGSRGAVTVVARSKGAFDKKGAVDITMEKAGMSGGELQMFLRKKGPVDELVLGGKVGYRVVQCEDGTVVREYRYMCPGCSQGLDTPARMGKGAGSGEEEESSESEAEEEDTR